MEVKIQIAQAKIIQQKGRVQIAIEEFINWMLDGSHFVSFSNVYENI